jgi:hypothetical protein
VKRKIQAKCKEEIIKKEKEKKTHNKQHRKVKN